MKAATIALLSLLSMLALGLVAAGPRSCQAGSLGQLAFAIAVEETATGDPMVCPLASCPFSQQRDKCEELLNEEATVELNAAETVADESQVAEDQSSPLDYEHYYEDYGYEYGDDYDPYADDETTADEVAAEVADDMELNAAETSTDEELADDGYDAYYGEYADQYDYDYEYEYEYEYDNTQYGYDYDTVETNDASETDPVATDAECNDVDCQRVCFPPETECEYRTLSQISEMDLVVEITEDYTDEYYNSYYDYVSESSDAEEVFASNSADYSDEYYDSYYEEYYGDEFEVEEADARETESVEWYENDYEKYYSQEYYDELDAPAASEDELAEEPSAVEDETAEYDADAIYEDAVYGNRFYEDDFYRDARYDCPCPPVVADEAVVASNSVQDAYLAGNCIVETNADVIDDLPWADEVADAEADVAEIDVPAAGEASEYGSDYAEEFFDEMDADLEAKLVPLDAEAATCDANLPIVAAKTLQNKFDVSRLAARCGSQVAAWTDTLAGLGKAVRTACADLEAGVQTR